MRKLKSEMVKKYQWALSRREDLEDLEPPHLFQCADVSPTDSELWEDSGGTRPPFTVPPDPNPGPGPEWRPHKGPLNEVNERMNEFLSGRKLVPHSGP